MVQETTIDKQTAVLYVFHEMQRLGLKMDDLTGAWRRFCREQNHAKQAKAAFVQKVRERMAELGLKPHRLANRVGVDGSTVGVWLREKKYPSRQSGERLCRVLDFEWDLSCLVDLDERN